MNAVRRGTPAGDAYLDLQRQARETGRPTNELHQLYALEGFLARLVVSPVRDQFVLKGGVLLAAFGNRRPTRDVDLSGQRIGNDTSTILELVRSVLTVTLADDDGLAFRPDLARAEMIREDDDYSGVRVSTTAMLDRSRLTFHIDVSVGDPIHPGPTYVSVPRLRGGEPIAVAGYPMHMVLAEKIVTAVQRGTANTRWRDFGDIWILSRHHPIAGSDLQNALVAVAQHRRAAVAPLREVLDGYSTIGQGKWTTWRQRNNCSWLPERFGDVLDTVITLADPVLAGAVSGRTWKPNTITWS